ncbi:hypothetical protein WUBG_07878 [Wuchereria bancrofti]|uniref:Uncharacterized protein n=1 Tax=Wuchereria bancrofti TaxID=6293 RepID=J9EFI5_WUCBA|nr:hypothetical protein WUBG_07878 [Wuchereria bancrofti]
MSPTDALVITHTYTHTHAHTHTHAQLRDYVEEIQTFSTPTPTRTRDPAAVQSILYVRHFPSTYHKQQITGRDIRIYIHLSITTYHLAAHNHHCACDLRAFADPRGGES